MEPERKPNEIRVADFSDPKPFKTVPGAFHPYTYVPLLGWLPPIELNLLIALVAISLAVAVPQPSWPRRLIAFFIVPAGLAAVFGAFAGLFWLMDRISRLWFKRVKRARLSRALSDRRAEERLRAAQALGLRGADAAEAVPELIAAARDSDSGVRAAAVEALGLVGPKAAAAAPILIERLAEDELSWQAARSLGQLGPGAQSAVVALAGLLRHAKELCRTEAAEALGKMGPKAAAAVPALTAALGDAAWIVRFRAAESLGKLGAAAAPAVPALAKLLSDEDCWRQAARALGRIGGAEAERALEGLAAHADAGRRAEAEAALACLRGVESGPS